MPDPPPAGLIVRWEALSTGAQAAIAFPVFTVLFFLLNACLFALPIWRSILYGLVEAAPFTALLLWVTAGERRQRGGG